MSDLLSVNEALRRILAHFSPLPAEDVPLEQVLNRVLAADLCSDNDHPPFDNSSVDGFAVRAADIASATPQQPIRLSIVEEIPAGSIAARALDPGQAASIMTGAALPDQADAVVLIEDSNFATTGFPQALPAELMITAPLRVGENVRRKGKDLHTGQRVLTRGRLVLPQDVGMLAIIGAGIVPVHRKPRVAILSTGSELIPPSAPLVPGKIRESNSYALAALAAVNGADVLRLDPAPDDPAAVRSRLDEAVDAGVDLILTSAGVSVGAHDYVRDILQQDGRLDFWRVNMRPGKPLAFGTYRGVRFFGLPGNPVSSFVTFLVFVQPALRRLAGLEPVFPTPLRAVLSHPVESDGRESYLRAVVAAEGGKFIARLTGDQGSGNMFSLVLANSLLIIPSGVKSLSTGNEVEFWWLGGFTPPNTQEMD